MEHKKGLNVWARKAILLIAIAFIGLIFVGCSKQFARLEENQAQIQTMVQTNAKQLEEIQKFIELNRTEFTAQIQQVQNEQVALHESSQESIKQVAINLSEVIKNQSVLKTGLVVSHNEAAKIGNDIAALDKKQSELYNTVQANDSRLTEKVASLAQGQNSLQAGIKDSKNQTLEVSSQVAALGKEQTKLHETSQSSIHKVANHLNEVSKNQDVLKNEMAVSHNEAAKIGNDIAVLDKKQSELYNTVKVNDNKLTEKVALLQKGQSSLQADIQDSKNETLKLSSEVASLGAEQTKLHQTSQENIQQVANYVAEVAQNQEILKTGIVVSHNETAKVANNISALDQKQSELYNTVKANDDMLSEKVVQLQQGQSTLQAGINESKKQALQISSEMASLGTRQTMLFDTSKNRIEQVASLLNKVAKDQEVIKTGLVVSHNETAKVANNVNALDQKQDELQSAIETNNNSLKEQIAAITQNQNSIEANINESKNQTMKLSSEIAALDSRQSEFNEASKEQIEQIAGHLNNVSQNQEVIKTGLVVSHNETAKASNEIKSLNQMQSELYDTVQANDSKLTEKVAQLQQSQSSLQAGMEESKNQASQISSEVAAISNEQAKLVETSQANIQQIVNYLNEVAESQEIIKTGLVVSHNETAKVANNVTQLSAEQIALQESYQESIHQIADYINEVSRNQEILKAGLVVSHNETAKVANNISALDNTHKELTGVIQDGNLKLIEKVALLEKNHSELQASIDNVQNENREIAANISSVGEEQVNFQEAVQIYNEQLNDRVNDIEKGQQEWETTISQMQQSIQQVAGNISTFEQNLAKLHEIFQSGMGELITSSSANSKEQSEFQEKMKKDFLALSDSVNVIKKSQNQLQQKIEDVQTSTESITVELPIAIEQLRQEMNKEEETAYSSDQ